MVIVSISLDDLDTIVKALDSADFYINSSPENEKRFYEHKDKLQNRLEKLLQKWDKIKEIDDKIKWNKQIFHLGRGFHTVEEFITKQNELRNERYNIISKK